MATTRILAVSAVHIRDLSIALGAGETRDVDFTTAKSSTDLRRLQQEGRVRLRRIGKHMNPKKTSTRFPALGVLLHAPGVGRQVPPPAIIPKVAPAPTPPTPVASSGDMATIMGMVQDLQTRISQIQESIPTDVLGRIEEVVRAAVPASPAAVATVASSVGIPSGIELPVFVPKDLGKVAETDVRVSFKEDTTEGDVQGAMESLRKMRRK